MEIRETVEAIIGTLVPGDEYLPHGEADVYTVLGFVPNGSCGIVTVEVRHNRSGTVQRQGYYYGHMVTKVV